MGTAAAFRSRAASLGLKTVYDAGTQNPPDDSKTLANLGSFGVQCVPGHHRFAN
jgi:hypothetical protein